MDTFNEMEIINKSKELLSQAEINYIIQDCEELLKIKLCQLQRKRKIYIANNSLIENYGHKEGFLFTDEKSFKYLCIAYCASFICYHNWYLHIESCNTAINRIVTLLKYIKKKTNELSKNIYETVWNILWNSEMPFREGGEYSRLLIYFPPNIDNIEEHINNLNFSIKDDELKLLDLYNKTDGLDFPYKEDRKNISRKIFNNRLKDLTENEITALKKSIIDMIFRNHAIFLLVFFHLHGSTRTRYSRESERITSCVYFRHLQYKSQVMFNNASDDQRTRLTHTLEVSGIAKTIAKQLGCNSELAEAISLGHDVGHVPFGHQGEEALDECLHDAWAGRFMHALQSVYVLGRLAYHPSISDQFGIQGLCLSRPVLEGILKHDTDVLLHDVRSAGYCLQYNGWRDSLYCNNDNIPEEIKCGLSLGGLESQIVYWSDKIAYAGHDWDEFISSGLVEQLTSRIEHILKRMHQLRHMAHGRAGGRDIVDNENSINNEIDLIRCIRFFLEHIKEVYRKSQEAYGGINEQGMLTLDGQELKNRLNDFIETIGAIIKKIEKEKIELKYFTYEEYKLLYNYFNVSLSLINLTGIFPKPYKKTDDIIQLLANYLLETGNRTIVRSLIPNLVHHSKRNLQKSITETTIRVKAVTEMNNNKEIENHRKYFRKKDRKPIYKTIDKKTKETRVNKQKFRKCLQKMIVISMQEDIVVYYNNLIDFVREYYIGSERVRIMEYKAHKIIKELFDFFMYNEDMLPVEYQSRISFDAQKLLTVEDYFSDIDGNIGSEKKAIVLQYITDRLSIADKQKILLKSKYEVINDLIKEIKKGYNSYKDDKRKQNEGESIIEAKDYMDKFYNYKIRLNKIQDVCRHIAKARVIADYIATMTDRYAEKKYNEIVSSSTAWSLSFHE